jgi:hypothetical protein
MTSLAHVGPTETQRNTNKGLVPSGVFFVLVGTSQLVLISDFGRNISLRLMARIYFSRCTTIRPTRLMLMGLFQLTPAIGTGIRQFFNFFDAGGAVCNLRGMKVRKNCLVQLLVTYGVLGVLQARTT